MRASVAVWMLALMVCSAPASAIQRPEVPPPPRPAENIVHLTEVEVIAQLPPRERQMVLGQTEPRDRFEVLLDVSELRLADIGAKVDAGAASVTPELLLYESVIRVTDELLRKPSTGISARDKRFKKLERRLARQLTLLKALVPSLSSDDQATGASVVANITRIRNSALESALDANVLNEP